MQPNIFSEIFERDINKLMVEISLYKNETDLWLVRGEIKNSAGNLALHLIGNLNFFIGATIGRSGYVRNREEEFSLKNVPKAKLFSEITAVNETVKNVLERLNKEVLLQNYPIEFQGKTRTIIEVLIILITHLNYHLGQINYHRRVISASEINP